MKISPFALSKITSNFQVNVGSTDQRVNIGLGLKYEGKALKVLGYSRKSEKGWEYSKKAFELIAEYKVNPPSL